MHYLAILCMEIKGERERDRQRQRQRERETKIEELKLLPQVTPLHWALTEQMDYTTENPKSSPHDIGPSISMIPNPYPSYYPSSRQREEQLLMIPPYLAVVICTTSYTSDQEITLQDQWLPNK